MHGPWHMPEHPDEHYPDPELPCLECGEPVPSGDFICSECTEAILEGDVIQ